MKLNSARQAWHDCYYQPWDSQGAFIEQLGLLGASVQTTEKVRSASHAAHSALAGTIQAAINLLSPDLKAFGHHMYSPSSGDDDKDDAAHAVFVAAVALAPTMRAKKFELARLVAIGVLFRYRRMHQGGQSEGRDPCPNPEAFRSWLLGELGVKLSSEQWAREWGGFIQACFEACNDLDKAALAPVARVMKTMKMAA